MSKTRLGFILIVSVLVLSLACGDDKNPVKPTEEQVKFSLTTDGKPALVMVIENTMGSLAELGFQVYPSEIKKILSNMFAIDTTAMTGMSLSQIVDAFGEDWQINQLKTVCAPKYQKIITLTDQTATSQILVDSLTALKNQNYSIDLLLNVKGSASEIIFYNNAAMTITDFITKLDEKDISIRAVYHTCDSGSGMIDDWKKYRIIAVNGAAQTNTLIMFSPIYFMQRWLAGETFADAVQNAYNDEITQLGAYASVAPVVSTMMISESAKNASKQSTGGLDKNLLFINYPVFE
ncbi:MAG TPA: hypothetical protein PLP19_11795 [bacterium]|nr:hypothetical protein [bacterium]HPN44164.1 hypothetical protein [bacterium]